MYITHKDLCTIKQIELVGNKNFTDISLTLNDDNFILHIVFIANSDIYPFCKALIASLIQNAVSVVILTKYADFPNIFSLDLMAKFSEYSEINNYFFNLFEDLLLPYGCIYYLELVELET